HVGVVEPVLPGGAVANDQDAGVLMKVELVAGAEHPGLADAGDVELQGGVDVIGVAEEPKLLPDVVGEGRTKHLPRHDTPPGVAEPVAGTERCHSRGAVGPERAAESRPPPGVRQNVLVKRTPTPKGLRGLEVWIPGRLVWGEPGASATGERRA